MLTLAREFDNNANFKRLTLLLFIQPGSWSGQSHFSLTLSSVFQNDPARYTSRPGCSTWPSSPGWPFSWFKRTKKNDSCFPFIPLSAWPLLPRSTTCKSSITISSSGSKHVTTWNTLITCPLV